MTTHSAQKETSHSSPTRGLLQALFVLVLLCLVISFASVPFYFESQTIRYKFGWDKTFLRTGQVLGMVAATLVFLQHVWTARLRYIESLFGMKRLLLFHRFLAIVLAICALLHPLFVFAPEDISNLAVEAKYWPEMLGGLLLIAIWFLVVVANSRSFLKLSFPKWRILHRINAFLVFVMLFFHVLYVSESFEGGVPGMGLFIVGSFSLILFGWVRIRPFLFHKK